MKLSGGMATLALLGVALLACAGDDADRLRVCGDLRVPGDADAVRVALLDEALEGEVWSGVHPLLTCSPRGSLEQLPVEIALPPRREARWLRVSALADGEEILVADWRVARGQSLDGVVVSLDARCVDTRCPRGQSCLAGTCALAPTAGDDGGSCATAPSDAADTTDGGDADASVVSDASGAPEADTTEASDAADASPDADATPAEDALCPTPGVLP
ncbi:MAG: hypothetical protein H6745_24950 [Deltaproteobacteria bacterium]|nr:hypothetical protein [Deltaproteobacteria bacterium]